VPLLAHGPLDLELLHHFARKYYWQNSRQKALLSSLEVWNALKDKIFGMCHWHVHKLEAKFLKRGVGRRLVGQSEGLLGNTTNALLFLCAEHCHVALNEAEIPQTENIPSPSAHDQQCFIV
jgi:hypothetical protein